MTNGITVLSVRMNWIKGWISWVSPLAKAMLGKQVGDTMHVQSPGGEEAYEVVDVRYVNVENSAKT